MDRRQYIALVGSVSTALVAGCGGVIEETDESKVRESSSDRVEFVSHRLAMIGTTPMAGDRGAGSNTSTQTADISGALAGTVKNVSEETLAGVRITAWFYSRDDGTGLVGEQSTVVEDLAPEEERDFFVPLLNREETAGVDDYELAAEVQ